MEVALAYGKKGLKINVPDYSKVVTPNYVELPEDDHAIVVNALRNPIGTKPLKELVSPKDKIVIVISDITRPTPNHKLVPWLLEELSHIPIENFTIINGTGTHRDETREELVEMLGEEIVNTVRIINHHCHEMSELKKVGRSSFGCDVYLNKEYVEADFRIVTGFIEPHFLPAFQGDPKELCPGLQE